MGIAVAARNAAALAEVRGEAEAKGAEALALPTDVTDAEQCRLAVNATVEGQTTAHYVLDRLAGLPVKVTRLAHGVPVGGELDYLDDGTLTAALKARRPL